MARFRLGSHQLGVARGRFTNPRVPWGERTCERCSAAHLAGLTCKVDDEFHMIFDCQAFDDLRGQHATLFQIGSNVRDFMTLGDDNEVISFISQCMLLIDQSLVAEQPG